MMPEDIEIVFCIFDILYLDGERLTTLPLRERHARLRTALRDAPAAGCALHGGATPIAARLVRVLPGATVPLLPGCPASVLWSVMGTSVRDIQVCS